jgi:hypothetical protein
MTRFFEISYGLLLAAATVLTLLVLALMFLAVILAPVAAVILNS